MDAFLQWFRAGCDVHASDKNRTSNSAGGAISCVKIAKTIDCGHGLFVDLPLLDEQHEHVHISVHESLYRAPADAPFGATGITLYAPVKLLEIPRDLFINGNTLISMIPASDALAEALSELHEHVVVTQDTLCIKELDERLVILLMLLFVRHYNHLVDYDNMTDARRDGDGELRMKTVFPINFSPFVDILPPVIDTPVFWTDHEIDDLLLDTPLHAATHAKRRKLGREFSDLRAFFDVLERWSCAMETRPKSPATIVTIDDFIWADAIFWSRVLSFTSHQDDKSSSGTVAVAVDDSVPFPRPDYHLIPCLDFANHCSHPLARWEVSSDGARLLTTVGANIQNGSEITISYGEKATGEFLFTYGFVPKLGDDDLANESYHFALDLKDAWTSELLRTLGMMPFLEVHGERGNHDQWSLLQHIMPVESATVLLLAVVDASMDDVVVDNGKLYIQGTTVHSPQDIIGTLMASTRAALLQQQAISLLMTALGKHVKALRSKGVSASMSPSRVRIAATYRRRLILFLDATISLLQTWLQ